MADQTQGTSDVTTTPAPEPTQNVPANPPAPIEQTKPVDAPASDVAPEQKPETTVPKEQEKPKPVVPEKYDLKLSENSILDDVFIKRTEAYAKAQGLSQEDAQSILKAQEEDVAAFMEDRKAEWKKTTLEDPEIGGEKLTENIALAQRMLKKFASPSLEKELTRSGYGNHPEMVRLFVKLGRMAGEDKAVIPGSQEGRAQLSIAERLYGTKD